MNWKPIVLIVLAVLGAGVTGYLTYTAATGKTPYCISSGVQGCSVVTESAYAKVGGVSIAAIGLIVWVLLVALTINHAARERKGTIIAVFIIAGIGVLAAGYYNGIMMRLGAFCIWCETAHALMITTFGVSGAMIQYTRKLAIAGAILFVIPFGFAQVQRVDPGLHDFATCLSEKNVTMYGAYWCPHCKNQKELFGDAWKNINYVECSLPNKAGQTRECTTKNITGYPTWEFSKGERISGEMSLDTLSRRTGCSLEQDLNTDK